MATAVEIPDDVAVQRLPPLQKLIVTIALMLAVIVQVLDTTIANVALPNMRASLGATQDSITWVLTSYIVASAIALPVSGWLAERIGRKRLLLLSVIGFTVTSVLCASATGLGQMVLYRALQGISGAFILPLAQAAMFDIYPTSKHGQAMALFGGGVMLGPIMGPVLGGWLTDYFNWRWVFLVNLPIGLVCTVLLWRSMPRAPLNLRPFELFSYILLAVALAALQLALDRGQHLGWLDSWEIIVEFAIAIAAGWMFVINTLTARDPLFERDMFADRNFFTSLIFMAATGVLLYGGLALLPPLLQTLYGYSVLQSGMLTAPRGIGMLVSMLLAGRLVGKMDARILVALGVMLMGYSLHMMTGFALQQPARPVIMSGFVQGLGLGLMFVPLQTLAFETLKPDYRTIAASVLNLSRNIGGSIGISIVTTQLVRMTQVSHADLATQITQQTMPTANPALLETVAPVWGPLTMALLNGEVTRQALFIAYLDDFKLMMIITLSVLPLLLLMRRSRDGSPMGAHAAMD